jgi:hypothetical protein
MSTLNIPVYLEKSIDIKQYQKMNFIMNALEEGWSIQKQNDSFIFSKKHEGKREVFKDSYLEEFILSNLHKNTPSVK